jgi:hypothetical protein
VTQQHCVQCYLVLVAAKVEALRMLLEDALGTGPFMR